MRLLGRRAELRRGTGGAGSWEGRVSDHGTSGSSVEYTLLEHDAPDDASGAIGNEIFGSASVNCCSVSGLEMGRHGEDGKGASHSMSSGHVQRPCEQSVRGVVAPDGLPAS